VSKMFDFFEILTIVAIIGGSICLVLFAKNKYQPEIERIWENRNKEKDKNNQINSEHTNSIIAEYKK
jgi:capsular polysaccharide biosynthesis protein